MGVDFTQITVIADVIASSMLFNVNKFLLYPRNILRQIECLQDRTGVLFAPAKIVNFRASRRQVELVDKRSHVLRMNVVAHLFSLITVNVVLPAFDVAFDEVTEKSMQLDAGMLRSRQAASAKTTGRHSEI